MMIENLIIPEKKMVKNIKDSFRQAFRGSILHFLENPAYVEEENSFDYFEDGLLYIENGFVKKCGSFETVSELLPKGVEIKDYTGKLIMPGFIDTHIHFPQTDIIASYGKKLMEWLETYTFPEEKKFKDKNHSDNVADFFLDELLRNGTTTALVLGTVHKESVEALFEKAQERNQRIIAGKVMMDRNCPEYLQDSPESGYMESKELIEKFHKKGRNLYAVTPRFAPTSTDEQLKKAGELLKEYDGLYLHTHVAENPDEIEFVKELFPDNRSYQDVYDQFELMGKRSVFAHAIYLDDKDFQRFSETGSAISFCPTSNLFLGSGLFNLKKSIEYNINVGIGTDVGGGTTFSMLKTLSEAYKVCQLSGYNLSAYQGFYLATLGGAKSLSIDDKTGNFEPGKEADFIVIDFKSTPLMKRRMENTKDIIEKLFALMMMGDDRSVFETYVMGKSVDL